MEMSMNDEIALEESISDWKRKADGWVQDDECPLCILGRKRNGDIGNNKCTNCIIKKHTGRHSCSDTPFYRNPIFPDYHQREIEFLESLRPKKKTRKGIIEIGDEVMINDYSWMYKLSKGKVDNTYVTGFKGSDDTIYTVVEVGVCLPESDDHKGKFGNDTILFELASGNYVFTRERYLRLAKPKYCPECGKAK